LKAVVLGGTSGIGRALARRLSARGDAVFLLGNMPEELARSAADLSARQSGGAAALAVGHAACDLELPQGFAAALDAADAALGNFDTVIITAAMFASQAELEQDHELARRLLTVNYAHTVLFCELVRERLLKRGGGRSKAGLSVYLEALDHKYHAAGLSVLCVKPGFVKTGMTAGLKPPPFAGEPDQVAVDVLAAMDRGRPLLYTPRMWALVMLVIRLLPRFVMRKINF
jgi:decaprenylphospho-beta-D-erythro-pentofuranosid-2-ulose 2-reductase